MESRNRVAATLAIIVLVDFSLMLGYLVFGTVNAANKDFLNMMLVALISFVNIGFGYYLGSSIGSLRKTDIMAQPESVPGKLGESGFVRLPLLPALCALLAASLLVSGCAGIQQQSPEGLATKSLLVMKETITAAAVIGDRLCDQKVLTPEQCTQLAVIYGQAKPAYDVAADSLALAIRMGSQGDAWDRYRAALLQFNYIFTGAMDLSVKLGIVPALEGGVK